jgi:serine/threonine protein kinase
VDVKKHETDIDKNVHKKQKNLLSDCSVKICDFGLSRALGEFPQSIEDGPPGSQPKVLKRQLTGHVVTRWYRAPELILLQENYTEQIDSGVVYMPEAPHLFRRPSKWIRSIGHLQLPKGIFQGALDQPSRENWVYCDIKNTLRSTSGVSGASSRSFWG